MPRLIIDNREIEVPEGTKVIDAAEKLGIMIPRFCYHPALGSVGACRVCAVKVLEGYCTGIQMSCMIDAADGMVVSTTDGEAVDFRKDVIEWLMLNHPHDCPVCDEGGHCLLQDMTVSGGHGLRRFSGKKRTHRDQYLGPLVQHEMNRCIQCYRCTRYYREFAGYPDLGVMGIGSRVYFGRCSEGTLESPFSGNLTDICPTGVYTDKPSRFRGRRWDFERTVSLCINCSLGCRTIVDARYREVVRQEAGFHPDLNGHFICDRGRYGFYYAGSADRPRSGRVDGEETARGTAAREAVLRLKRISHASGPAAVALAGAARSSLETLSVVRHICRSNGWTGPSFFPDRRTAEKARTAVAMLEPDLSISLKEVAAADFILVVAADPVNESPMLAMAMRQAFRNGARIAVMDPRPVELPMAYQHLPIAAETIPFCLGALLKSTADRDKADLLGRDVIEFLDTLPGEGFPGEEKITALAADLKGCRHPVIVCGTDVSTEPAIRLAADAARLLSSPKKRPGLFYLMPAANGFGAAMVADDNFVFDQIVEGIEAGNIRALVLVENDPFWYYPDRHRLESAFEQLDLLVVLDYLDSPAARAADILIPTTTLYEDDGLFINQEGRIQHASPAFRGGQSVEQTGNGGHPPRSFRKDIPGGGPLPAWQIVAGFAGEETDSEDRPIRERLRTWLSETHPAFAELPTPTDFPAGGIRVTPGKKSGASFRFEETAASATSGDGLSLLAVDWTFGTEELCRYSPCLQEREEDPCLLVQIDDAAMLELADGDTAVIETDSGSVRLPVKVMENMAVGTVVLPRHRRIDWQVLGKTAVKLEKGRIHKASGEESC